MSPADYHRQSPQQQSVFLCVIMQPAAFLCVLCVICERITRKSTQLICTMKPQSLPQISLIYADKTQNNINYKLSFLRNNAACCIRLRHLRYLRENTRKSTQTIGTKKPQCSLADHADYRRQNHETTLTTICLSLRDNAACCIPLRDLRYLRENNTQEYSINLHNEPPISLPLISQIYAEKYNCGKPYYISALKFTI